MVIALSVWHASAGLVNSLTFGVVIEILYTEIAWQTR